MLNNHSTVVGTLNILGYTLYYTNIRSFLEVLEHIRCKWTTCGSSVVIGNTVHCNNHTNNNGDTKSFSINSTTNSYPGIFTINSTEDKNKQFITSGTTN